jgi:hypothetical protein
MSADLTEPQRRHLRTFLGHFEAVAAEVVRLAESPLTDRALAVDEFDLPAGFNDRVRPEFERIRRSLETLAARCGLEPERRSRRRRVQALLIAAVVEVADADSRGLAAYGPVDPGLSGQLDPLVEDIGNALGAILSTLEASLRQG